MCLTRFLNASLDCWTEQVANMSTTMDSKGRITLPGCVVEALGLAPGDVVDFVLNGDGEIIVRNVSASSCCIPDRFDAARGKADVPWQTRELMAFLRSGD